MHDGPGESPQPGPHARAALNQGAAESGVKFEASPFDVIASESEPESVGAPPVLGDPPVAPPVPPPAPPVAGAPPVLFPPVLGAPPVAGAPPVVPGAPP